MRRRKCAASGRPLRYASVNAFCWATQLATSGELRSSSQRYGSGTFVPWYSSTTSTLRVSGYRMDCGTNWTCSNQANASAGAIRKLAPMHLTHGLAQSVHHAVGAYEGSFGVV